MSKVVETEFKINTDFLRSNPVFSLAPKGQEIDIEYDKCNFYTKRESSPDYIVQTYSVGNLKSVLEKMVIWKEEDITVKRGPGVSVHYIIDIYPSPMKVLEKSLEIGYKCSYDKISTAQ